jgi:hypothetical protein
MLIFDEIKKNYFLILLYYLLFIDNNVLNSLIYLWFYDILLYKFIINNF